MNHVLTFAALHGLSTETTEAGLFILIVPNGALNPLWREAWAAFHADGKAPSVWSAGQLVVSL